MNSAHLSGGAVQSLDEEKEDDAIADGSHRIPFDDANVFSRETLSWLNPLLSLGAKRPLEESDLFSSPSNQTVSHVMKRFLPHWANISARRIPKYFLFKALALTIKRPLGISAVLYCIFIACQLSIPYLIHAIVNAISPESQATQGGGFWGITNGNALVGLLVAVTVISVFTVNSAYCLLIQGGLTARNIIMHAVYQKALRLSSQARQASTLGETVTLMSVDSERVFALFRDVHWLWAGVVIFALDMGLLVNFIGLSALAGVFVMIVVLSLQFLLAALIKKARRNAVNATQERVKLINETLQGIRVIKYSAWEEAITARVQAVRDREIRFLKHLGYINTGNMVVLFLSPVFVAGAVFLVYVSTTGEELTAPLIFTTMAYLNILRLPLGIIPDVVAALMEAIVSVRRLEGFFGLSEVEPLASESQQTERHASSSSSLLYGAERRARGSIELSDASFSWSIPQSNEKRGKEPDLASCSLSIPAGSLCGVVGPVGSGKSSLLHALLGEMHQQSGSAAVNGKIAYVSQQAWIQHATLRDNVLFYSPFVSERYTEVVQATQLVHDLSILPKGDQTELGERGINLSGGQKARVSLARALYRKESTDIFLLDDPLSAVDAHVARHIFSEGVLSLLQGKTRLLVLNSHYHCLRRCDQVIIMGASEEGRGGRVLAVGSPLELAPLFPEYFSSLGAEEADLVEDRILLASSVPLSEQEHQVRKDDRTSRDKDEGHADKEGREIQGKVEGGGAGKGRIKVKESKESGAVTAQIYVDYFGTLTVDQGRHGGTPSRGNRGAGAMVLVVVLLGFALSQAGRTVSDWWLAVWSERKYDNALSSLASNTSLNAISVVYLWIYVILTVFTSIITLLRSFLLIHVGLKISAKLHKEIFYRILRAPVTLFYDVTPLGQILNRFSKDLDQVDCRLPDYSMRFLQNGFLLISTFIFCCYSFFYSSLAVGLAVFACFLIISLLYLAFSVYFRRSSRELKRLESISRSPIFSSFHETLNGLSTVRAFAMQGQFLAENESAIDENTGRYFTYSMAGRWLALRLDLLSALVVLLVGLFAVKFSDNLSVALACLALIYATQLTGLLQWTVNNSVMVENCMTSTERVLHYLSLPLEEPEEGRPRGGLMKVGASGPPVIIEKSEEEQLGHVGHYIALEEESTSHLSQNPESSWPTQGAIEFHSVVMRYRPELETVLQGVSFSVRPQEKVGICGRTGAGKSSIMLALFRIVNIEAGRIVIDGVDISSVSLRHLRSRLAMIPQDPVMFSGTIRDNLDPFHTYDDGAIWDVLRKVHLANEVAQMPQKLESSVAEGGDNLSVGQRQLICIGRALLKSTTILVMDEATASVDTVTDALIQQTIRKNFKDRTVLCIAHRLETILDSDRIAVISDGTVAEFDYPEKLLGDPESRLTGLVAAMREKKAPIS